MAHVSIIVMVRLQLQSEIFIQWVLERGGEDDTENRLKLLLRKRERELSYCRGNWQSFHHVVVAILGNS
jgi:hypothetical protein